MKFVIPGIPQPLARHRSCTRNGQTFLYDPSKQYKKFVSQCISQEITRLANSDSKQDSVGLQELASAEAFIVNMTFYFPPNKSDSVVVRNQKLWGLVLNTTKPDADNCYKLYSDAANEILYPDDCMIVKGSFEKRFSDNPRTEIEIFLKKKEKVNEMTQEILKMFSPAELKELFDDIRKLSQLGDQDKELFEGNISGQIPACDGLIAFSEKYGDRLMKLKKKKEKTRSI